MDSTNDPIAGLEGQLQRSLRPIQPSQAFVHRLQSHLAQPGPTLAHSPFRVEMGLVLAAGLMVGLAALWIFRQQR
jgi:hypothetical protein